jgi:peptidoglycan LD-endopeptidase CwlK
MVGLQPIVSALAQKLVDQAKQKGIEVRIVRGYISFEDQQKLYDAYLRGEIPAAVPPSTSPHVKGLAFDIVILEGEQPTTDVDKYRQVGEIAKSLGLKWGGEKDKKAFHFEYVLQPE